jgi:MacB-like periplasmic core domain
MMEWTNILMARLRALFRRESVLRDIEEELRVHVEMETETNIKRGMPPDEARAAALKSFGNPIRNTERGYDLRGGGWIETLWQDLRYGARMLMKNPGFTLVAVVTLALGIGASVAVFSVVNSILIRSLPYKDSDRLVMISEKTSQEDLPVTHPNYVDWKNQNQVFESTAAFRFDTFNLTGLPEAERLGSMTVSSDFLPTLGVNPIRGRGFRLKTIAREALRL